MTDVRAAAPTDFVREMDALAEAHRQSEILTAEDYAVRINARDDDPQPVRAAATSAEPVAPLDLCECGHPHWNHLSAMCRGFVGHTRCLCEAFIPTGKRATSASPAPQVTALTEERCPDDPDQCARCKTHPFCKQTHEELRWACVRFLKQVAATDGMNARQASTIDALSQQVASLREEREKCAELEQRYVTDTAALRELVAALTERIAELEAGPYEARSCRGHWHVYNGEFEIVTDAGSALSEDIAKAEAARMNARLKQDVNELQSQVASLSAALERNQAAALRALNGEKSWKAAQGMLQRIVDESGAALPTGDAPANDPPRKGCAWCTKGYPRRGDVHPTNCSHCVKGVVEIKCCGLPTGDATR